MSKGQVLIIAHPREAERWTPALRARGLEVSSAASRKAAGAAGIFAPAVVVVSEKLPMAGALRVTRDLRRDPATRECPVVMVGLSPFTPAQRLRLRDSAPDATAPKQASPEEIAEIVVAAMRAGKLPPPELTPAQQTAAKYQRVSTLLMMMGVFFSFPVGRAPAAPQAFDRTWFVLLVPLGGLVGDIATGRVDARKRLLSWQGWAAIALMGALAVGIAFWPRVFSLR